MILELLILSEAFKARDSLDRIEENTAPPPERDDDPSGEGAAYVEDALRELDGKDEPEPKGFALGELLVIVAAMLLMLFAMTLTP